MATINVDWDIGFPYQAHEITLTDTSNDVTFDDPQDSTAPLILKIIQGAGVTPKTLTWPGNVLWTAGIPPVLSLTAGSVDIIELIALNNGGGFDYYGRVFGLNIT